MTEADLQVQFVKNGRLSAIPPLNARVRSSGWRAQLEGAVRAHLRQHMKHDPPLLVLCDDDMRGRVLIDNGRQGSGLVRRVR